MQARIFTFLASLLVVASVAVAVIVLRAGSVDAAAVQVLDATIGQPVSNDPRSVHFVLHEGQSAAAVGRDLEAAGLVRSALGFRLVVQLSGLASHLEAGDYELSPSMPLNQVVSILAQGRMAGGLLTIPEGWRALEIADALQRDHVTARAEFIRIVQHPDFPLPAFLQGLPPGGSLEGFLFPDSYRFRQDSPADDVVKTMVDAFGSHLSPDLEAGFRANGLSVYQAVTLASIVEREAVVPAERPTIASVYLNRLKRGMRLQADPTVQYALVPVNGPQDPPSGYWKAALTLADLKVGSPYNTYEVVGLPPGPICNPGMASLEAVAHPATTDYLYFVARPDRTHAFARTLEEHEQNVTKYQR